MSQNRESTSDLKQHLRNSAIELGFHAVGLARARALPADLERLERWLTDGHHAGMGYMNRWLDVRGDPRHSGMVADAGTVVSVALAYPAERPRQGLARHVACYARGLDYHDVLRDMLRRLLAAIRAVAPEVRGRALVDTAPLLERAWAVRAGLGWIGRNSCLISPGLGSMFVLGELVLDCELEPDADDATDGCGDCRACIEACPNAALSHPDGRVLDARRCASYWTIEAASDTARGAAGELVLPFFGCDVCQLVCPHNQGLPALETPLAPLTRWDSVTLQGFADMSIAKIEELIEGTALERAGAEALRARAGQLCMKNDQAGR